jgi:SAM-dependent methyltransferase
MPSLEWNKNTWDKSYNWDNKGEEWSQCWGCSESQWFSSIYPRIHRFISCENVLEIACGYGRWTKFLIEYTSGEYRGIDLSSECINYCNNHFKQKNVNFIKNDGLSLNDVADLKYDFIFSFDSLVHVNPEILEIYIRQIVELLTENGVCFIHHSNFGSIIEKGIIDLSHQGFVHNRDQESSAKKVKEIIVENRGKVLCQEIIDWGGAESLDCLTLFSKKDSYKEINEIQLVNKNFMKEAMIIKDVHNNYSFKTPISKKFTL